jgi:hypothetical protein
VNNSAADPGLEALWTQISSALRAELGEGVYDRWFSTLRLAEADAREVTLVIPNSI